MDCRQFRKQHALFIDDSLSGVAAWAMREHVSHCGACGRLDAQLRRAMMVARSAPMLEPSPEFQRRLSARLAAERLANPAGRAARRKRAGWTRGVPLAAAATLLIAIGVGATATRGDDRAGATTLVLAPVVVSPPTLPTEPVAAPAMFATVSSSLPVYAAMLLAQRATEQFAATHARTVTFQAAR